MDNFYNTAIMVIYEDGSIDKLEIGDKLLHMHYFAHLYKKNSKFKKIILENDLGFCDEEENVDNFFTYQLDLGLANQNIIAMHNLNIKEIHENPNYLEKNIPKFIFTMPSNLTNEQKTVLEQILNENDLYDSEFLVYEKDHFGSLEYEDIINLVHQKKY